MLVLLRILKVGKRAGDFGLHSVTSPACSHRFRSSCLGWLARFAAALGIRLRPGIGLSDEYPRTPYHLV
jgi:hypothetical protein